MEKRMNERSVDLDEMLNETKPYRFWYVFNEEGRLIDQAEKCELGFSCISDLIDKKEAADLLEKLQDREDVEKARKLFFSKERPENTDTVLIESDGSYRFIKF